MNNTKQQLVKLRNIPEDKLYADICGQVSAIAWGKVWYGIVGEAGVIPPWFLIYYVLDNG